MSQGIRTLKRGLEILLALGQASPPRSLSLEELRELLPFELDRTTLYRHLATMESLDFVERDPDGQRYRLGPAVLDLAAGFLADKKLVLEADVPMQELAKETGETVYLAILDESQVLHLHKKEPHSPYTHMPAGVGSKDPAYCTSLGKAILAYLPEEEVDRVLAQGMPERTPSTLTTPAALKKDLEATRQRGYSLDQGELHNHVRCVGAPIFGPAGRVIAAISVAGTTATLSDERLHEVGPLVRQTARRISRRMGALFYPFRTLDAPSDASEGG